MLLTNVDLVKALEGVDHCDHGSYGNNLKLLHNKYSTICDMLCA